MADSRRQLVWHRPCSSLPARQHRQTPGRSPGSRAEVNKTALLASCDSPSHAATQWRCESLWLAYRCGGSAGFAGNERPTRTGFPIHSSGGTPLEHLKRLARESLRSRLQSCQTPWSFIERPVCPPPRLQPHPQCGDRRRATGVGVWRAAVNFSPPGSRLGAGASVGQASLSPHCVAKAASSVDDITS